MSIIKVLFYGNCQLGAICKTLNLNSNKYHVTYVECHGNEVKNFSQEYFFSFFFQSKNVQSKRQEHGIIASTGFISITFPEYLA